MVDEPHHHQRSYARQKEDSAEVEEQLAVDDIMQDEEGSQAPYPQISAYSADSSDIGQPTARTRVPSRRRAVRKEPSAPSSG